MQDKKQQNIEAQKRIRHLMQQLADSSKEENLAKDDLLAEMRKQQRLRRVRLAMGEYPFCNWGEMAREHWKKHLPNLYRGLKEEGTLERMLNCAQENAVDLYIKLTDKGAAPHTAREIVLPEYILLPAEGDDELEEWEIEEGENNQLLAFERWLKSLSEN